MKIQGTGAKVIEPLNSTPGGTEYALPVRIIGSASGRSVAGDLADGVRYVAREPTLRALVLLAAIPGLLFVAPFAVTVPLTAWCRTGSASR